MLPENINILVLEQGEGLTVASIQGPGCQTGTEFTKGPMQSSQATYGYDGVDSWGLLAQTLSTGAVWESHWKGSPDVRHYNTL